MSTGTGLARVWVWVQVELPMGYPCYALALLPVGHGTGRATPTGMGHRLAGVRVRVVVY